MNRDLPAARKRGARYSVALAKWKPICSWVCFPVTNLPSLNILLELSVVQYFAYDTSSLHSRCFAVASRTPNTQPTTQVRNSRDAVLSLSTLTRRANGLLETRVLRLDWQRISSIQNLDAFTCVRELYLQHNRIQVIEELDTLQNLQILALGSNRIRCVENLRHLEKVRLLAAIQYFLLICSTANRKRSVAAHLMLHLC